MISEREAKTLVGVYEVVKTIVFVAGIVLLVTVVFGMFRETYLAGQRNTAAVSPAVAAAQVEQPEPAAGRPVRRRRIAPPPVTDETGQGEAEPETNNVGWVVGAVPAEQVTGMPAPPPVAPRVVVVVPPVADPVPNFSVTAKAKKHHWPRRLVGAIGRGLGKVIGVR